MEEPLIRLCYQPLKHIAHRRCTWMLIGAVVLLAFSTYYIAWDIGELEDEEIYDYNEDDAVTVDPMSDGEEEDDDEEDEEAEDKDAPRAAEAPDVDAGPGKVRHDLKDDDQQSVRRGMRPAGAKLEDRGAHDGDQRRQRRRNPAAVDKDRDGDVGIDGAAGEEDENDDKEADENGVDGNGGNEQHEEKNEDNGEDEGNGNGDDEETGDDQETDNDEGQPGKSYDTCDAECQKFRGELASWPPNKPKAFIYYLIHRPAIRSLRKSIQSLHRNFNRRFRYPIVVFVEPNLDNEADRRRIAEMVPADTDPPPPPLYVQVVRFRIPKHVNVSLVPRMAGFGSRKRTIGYRHMCRFHAGGVYEQPIVRSPGLQYGWRLDDDSLIRRPINQDLFQVMLEGKFQYGYRRINTGWSPVDYALWDAVDRYLNATPSLVPTFYHQWPKNAARYFNNFEISDLSVWLSPKYRDYFNFVDQLGGIYYHKWGDAAIKTIAVSLFIPRDRTHLFTGITYSHN